MTGAAISPIAEADAFAVATFFHRELNSAVSVDSWAALLQPPWPSSGPNRGFQLRDGDRVVGAYAAVYSQREVDGTVVQVCNLAAFCVLEQYRMHSVRLVRALLKQRGLVFTDLSPSGNVVAMNERLGFTRLDPSTRLVANLPLPPVRGIRLSRDPDVLAATLRGRDAEVYRDHRGAAAARHLLIIKGDDYAYLVYRAHSLKRLRLFALPLYVGGSRAVLDAGWRAVRSRLLLEGLAFTLAERRLLPFARGLGRELRRPRTRMIRGAGLAPAEVDYLYSELALVSW